MRNGNKNHNHKQFSNHITIFETGRSHEGVNQPSFFFVWVVATRKKLLARPNERGPFFISSEEFRWVDDVFFLCVCVTSSDSSFIFSLRCVSINWNGLFFFPSNIDVLLEMQWAWASIKNKCRWKRKRQSSKCDYSVDPIQSVAVLGSVLNYLFNDIGACSFIRLPNSLICMGLSFMSCSTLKRKRSFHVKRLTFYTKD